MNYEMLVDHLLGGEVTYLTFYDVLTKPSAKKRAIFDFAFFYFPVMKSCGSGTRSRSWVPEKN